MNQPRIVVLTGAGISAESGVRTFRDNGGLWEEHRVEDVATPDAWASDPEMVWRFYQARRRQLLEVQPNGAHLALVLLQKNMKQFTLITQNVDDLHERGGSSDVIHMHGELRTLRCEASQRSEVRMQASDLTDDVSLCSCCANPVRMRPDIVWFGEIPMHMEAILNAVETCEVFIVVGSSGHVYPAAGLVDQANNAGARTVLVNLEAPINASAFDEILLGPAGELLPQLVDRLISDND
ncbi:MAG: NAD-dependent deacylase [Candidatus Poseidonia sp.]|uniref:NAD-dependent deacylase n=1 Tax=Poseidonia sp. TaxID=2666344 RepID=UPI0030C65897|nr:NAD-dependent deacylase [Poseidonia sp.]